MKTRNIILLAAALTLAAASLAVAKPGARAACAQAPACGPGQMKERIFEKLDLSEAQQEAIDKIRTESRESGVETRKRIMRLQNELEGLMLQDEPDAGEVEKLVREIGELKTEQRVRRALTRLEVREQLTDEQRDKMLACKGDRGPRLGRRGQGRAPKGQRGGRF